MRITSISVTKLFGKFDHVIPLNMDERITIIYGPNGIGKTVLLRMVDSFFHGRLEDLAVIPFASLQIDLDNGGSIIVNQSKDNPKLEEFIKADVWLSLLNESCDIRSYDIGYTMKATVTRTHGMQQPFWYPELQKSLDVHLIETERLLGLRKGQQHQGDASSTVMKYAHELARTLGQVSKKSEALAQSLDSTFLNRIVEEEVEPEITMESLRNDLAKLEERRAKLVSIGVLDRDAFQMPAKVDDTMKNVFMVYISDGNKKLDVFDEISPKCKLLQEIINARFLYKRMMMSREHGFLFTTDDGDVLSPKDLSTGEQHEVVMFYELLFKTEPNTLVLIDEPEISLHVYWQRRFLRDVQKILALASFDVLIATHSPQIIHDRGDLVVPLESPEEKGKVA